MKRSDLTEKILDIKREKGWTWKFIAEEIGGVSPVLVVGALMGQMKLVKPLAFVVLRPGTQGSAQLAEELIAYCRQHLAKFKLPKGVVFGPLPKTSTGKIQKFVLRDRAKTLA